MNFSWRKRLAGIACGVAMLLMFGGANAQTSNVVSSDTGMPKNMIFFSTGTSCPTGSTRATDANGRMLLVASNVGDVGKIYGSPLRDQQDRAHWHIGTMSVFLTSHHITGINGCCNTSATQKGSHTARSFFRGSASGLPFIQLLVCEVD